MGDTNIKEEVKKDLTMYDISIISYRLKRAIILNSFQPCGDITNMLLNYNVIAQAWIEGNVVNVITNPVGLTAISDFVNRSLISMLDKNKNQVLGILADAGYEDSKDDVYSMLINRINMLYTILQISEVEFHVIFS